MIQLDQVVWGPMGKAVRPGHIVVTHYSTGDSIVIQYCIGYIVVTHYYTEDTEVTHYYTDDHNVTQIKVFFRFDKNV